MDSEKASSAQNNDLYEGNLSGSLTWFWIIVTLEFLTISSSGFWIQNIYILFPFLYYISQIISFFSLFLPGYCLIKALFPQRELSDIETFTLNISVSISIIVIIAYILSYTNLNITYTSVLICQVFLSLAFSVIALVRNHHVRVTNHPSSMAIESK